MNESPIQPTPEEQLPEPIVAALRSRYGLSPEIPAAVNDAVRHNALRHLKAVRSEPADDASGQFRGSPLRWKWVVGSFGSLIAVVLLVAVWPRNPMNSRSSDGSSDIALSAAATPGPATEAARSAGNVAADLDRNGRIDILDAFALARSIQSGDTRSEMTDLNSIADLNQDGQLNQRDVDLIAMTAVTL